MGYFGGNLLKICSIITLILMLHVVVGNQFGHNAAFEYKKSKTLLGGQSHVPNEKIHDPDYKVLLEGIHKAENMDANLVFKWDSLEITSQVVQGILYHVKVDAQPKSCSALTSCDNVKQCSFKIWSRVWLPSDERLIIKDFACTDI